MLHLGAALSFAWISVSLTDNPATIQWLKAQCPAGDKSHQRKKKCCKCKRADMTAHMSKAV